MVIVQKLPKGFSLLQFPSTLELYFDNQFIDGWPLPIYADDVSEQEWQSRIDNATKTFEAKRNNA
jgi:hypothetical protein